MTAEIALEGVKRLLLDTNIVIYVLEKDKQFGPVCWAVIQLAVKSDIQLVVSPLTLIEVLSKPDMSEEEMKRSAEFCLSTNKIEFTPINFDDIFALRVGFFRRQTKAKIPDCIQFASAERLQCDAILNNNARDFRRHPTVKCLDIAQILNSQVI